MSIASGTRLGAYEILSALGAGNMGEVYRARDTKLNRDVALKVLPEAFALEPDRVARFKREAEILASLNHPNIAAIYGFEDDVGAGFSRLGGALVLELIEGPTLADRLSHGALPLEEALPIARQIAEALEAAHEHGVIHRDLKPANISVRPDGTVKVLDFGLAKLTEATRTSDVSVLSGSPTVAPALATVEGVLVGTPAYMSPEQAKGRPADKRSDMWAFGCVLYEMLTGKSAFRGDDRVDTLAKIQTSDVDWTALPSHTPAAMHRLLRRTLTRDARQRLSDAHSAQLDIQEALTFLAFTNRRSFAADPVCVRLSSARRSLPSSRSWEPRRCGC